MLPTVKPRPSAPCVLAEIGIVPLSKALPTASVAVKLPVPVTTPVWALPPPTVPRIASDEARFFDTERCISAKRTFSITCCVPPTFIRFDTRSPA